MENKLEKENFGYSEMESRYGIKIGTAYTLVHQKRIPHIRLGRRFVLFNSKSIETWLRTHEVAPIVEARKPGQN